MCDICSSKLCDDINRKINWRPDRVIKWAGKRGLAIDEKELKDHFVNHLDKPTLKKVDSSEKISAKKANGKIQKKTSIETNTSKKTKPPEFPAIDRVDDNRLLNEIIGRVYSNLLDDNFTMKIEYGFKAIELKQKLSGNSNVETLLLELLNEIRIQELAGTDNKSAR